MLRLLADENFNGRILRALKRQLPDLEKASHATPPRAPWTRASALGLH